MQHTTNKQKGFVSLFISMMMLFMLAMPVMAATDYPMVTLEDSKDFTIVTGINQSEPMKVQGLDASYVKQDLGADKQYVTWTTSDPSVAKFVSGFGTANSISGNDAVTVRTMGEGTAIITATYDTPTADPVSVTSYVVVEGSTVTSTVSNIEVAVEGVDIVNFTSGKIDVPLFNLVTAGITDDDSDVLQNTPTALHAFLYALELKYGNNTTTDVHDTNWNWNWVKDNVEVTSEGSYVSKVGADDSNTDWSRGWQFGIGSLDPVDRPDYAASVQPLTSGNKVHWGFIPW